MFRSPTPIVSLRDLDLSDDESVVATTFTPTYLFPNSSIWSNSTISGLRNDDERLPPASPLRRVSLPLSVRRRTEADLDDCVLLAQAVFQLDGYPPWLPEDLRSFLVAPDTLGAWVAESNRRIVGHVALRQRGSPPVMALAAVATGQPEGQLRVVARLLVSPAARDHGTSIRRTPRENSALLWW